MKEKFENKMEGEKMLTKEKVKDFTKGKWDMTFDWIAKELGANTEEEKKELEKFLDKLEEEEWIGKTYCGSHKIDEYDPGPEQWD